MGMSLPLNPIAARFSPLVLVAWKPGSAWIRRDGFNLLYPAFLAGRDFVPGTARGAKQFRISHSTGDQ